MLLLALDSSSSIVSVAMVDFTPRGKKETLLYHHHTAHERTDSSSLFGGLEKAITLVGKPELIVVGLGPGSYNGLRVSVAAAQGMASALGIQLQGIPSALAMESDHTSYWIAGDARGGKYWLASVVDHQFIQEPLLLPPESIEALILTMPLLPLLASTPLPQLSELNKMTIATPSAIALARRSQMTSSRKWELTPLYLKPAHITPPSSRFHAEKKIY
jgi:tRNA threonylcarbamoyl adenosine modification protein YeaZ